MAKVTRGKNLKDWKSQRPTSDTGKLRIIGGKYRGRQIEYSGDPVTRPMKENTREATFNLVGGYAENRVVIDLFAGTGAIGLEAMSRGAESAFLVERHFPTVRIIKQNVRDLDQGMKVTVAASDTFFWVRQFLKGPALPTTPWLVFCCPPYALYVDKIDELSTMLENLIAASPEDSLFVVESDDKFDPETLPSGVAWETRKYAPALISIGRKPTDESQPQSG